MIFRKVSATLNPAEVRKYLIAVLALLVRVQSSLDLHVAEMKIQWVYS